MSSDPAYDRAHHIQFAIDRAREATRLIETGDILGAHHALESAMEDVGAVLDIDRSAETLHILTMTAYPAGPGPYDAD